MKRIFAILTLLTLFLSFNVQATTVITKGLTGEQDQNKYDGVSNTFTRATSTGGTISLNKVGYEVDALMVYGGGVNYTDTTIQSALTAIGTTTKATIVLRPGTWVFSASHDWSAYTNIVFKMPNGAIISHGAYTLAIYNPPLAGAYQIFTGAGAVTITGYPREAAWNGSAEAQTAITQNVTTINAAMGNITTANITTANITTIANGAVVTTQSAGDNTAKPASDAFVNTAITNAILANFSQTIIYPSGDTTGATDVAAINAALAALPALGGAVILACSTAHPCPFNTNATIDVGNGTSNTAVSTYYSPRLIGFVNGGSVPGSTALTGVTINCKGSTPCITIHGLVTGWEISNLILNTSTASHGIKNIIGCSGHAKNIVMELGLSGAIGILDTTYSTAGNTSDNVWEDIGIYLGATNQVGIELTSGQSQPAGNTCFETFRHITIAPTSFSGQKAIWLQATDSDYFYSVHVYNQGTSPVGIYFDYSLNATWPADVFFYGWMGGSAISYSNTGTPSGATANKIYGFGTTNGGSAPSLSNLSVY